MAEQLKKVFQRKDPVRRDQVERLRLRLIKRVHRSHLIPLVLAAFLGVSWWLGKDLRSWQVWAPCAALGVVYFLTMALSVCPRCSKRFFGGLGWLFGFAHRVRCGKCGFKLF